MSNTIFGQDFEDHPFVLDAWLDWVAGAPVSCELSVTRCEIPAHYMLSFNGSIDGIAIERSSRSRRVYSPSYFGISRYDFLLPSRPHFCPTPPVYLEPPGDNDAVLIVSLHPLEHKMYSRYTRQLSEVLSSFSHIFHVYLSSLQFSHQEIVRLVQDVSSVIYLNCYPEILGLRPYDMWYSGRVPLFLTFSGLLFQSLPDFMRPVCLFDSFVFDLSSELVSKDFSIYRCIQHCEFSRHVKRKCEEYSYFMLHQLRCC